MYILGVGMGRTMHRAFLYKTAKTIPQVKNIGLQKPDDSGSLNRIRGVYPDRIVDIGEIRQEIA